jgi:hypothetical protein
VRYKNKKFKNYIKLDTLALEYILLKRCFIPLSQRFSLQEKNDTFLSQTVYLCVYTNEDIFILCVKPSTMKLKEYFHHQKHTILTDNEKFLLYQRVVVQRDIKKSFLQRYIFAKRIAYTSFVLIFIFAVYGVHFFRDDIRYMTNSLIVQRWWDLVQAWYIANIVQFEWSFLIEHNGKAIKTSVIHDGDIVTLRQWTQIVFHIDEQTKAQIIGPAQFILKTQENKDDAYTIELLQGDFVEIQSLQEQTTQEISLISDDVTIRQEKADSASHFQLVREGKWHRIENKGSQISLVQQNGKSNIAIASRQTLKLADNDITLIDQETQIARVLMQKDVSQTVAFADVSNNTENFEDISVDALSRAFEVKDNLVDEDVVSSVITAISKVDDKRVIAPEENTQLRNILHDWLLQDIQFMYEVYLQWDDLSFQKSAASLQAKIANIQKTFWLTVTTQKESSQNSFTQTIQTVRSLAMHLENEYYIPPRYIHNLQTIAQLLEYINRQEFGSLKDSSQSSDISKRLLPNNLRFQ